MQMSCNNQMVHLVGFFTIAYSTDITFGFNLEQSIYIVLEMQLHFHNNFDNKNTFPFPKHITM